MQIHTIYSNKTCAVCGASLNAGAKSGRNEGRQRLESERFEADSFENQLPFLSSYICSGCIRLMYRTLAAAAADTE